MKTLLKALACLCALFVLTGASCNKEEILPPETQTGAHSFGCLVNGKIFTAKGYGSDIDSYYQYIYPSVDYGYVFQIAGKKKTSNQCEFTSIVINGDSIKIEEGKTYRIGTPARGGFQGEYYYSPPDCNILFDKYVTTDKLGGEISFTKFDQASQIVSGTFWFDVVDKKGDTIKIREGRFDEKYTR